MTFRLEKAYVDVIDDSGIWWIGYDASLSWGPLRLNYQEIVGPGVKASRTRLGQRETDITEIAIPGKVTLQVSGGRVTDPALSFRNAVLEWRLTHLRADVLLRFAQSQRTIAATGYAEIVVLHRPPWQLGISELHWGRYISASRFAVWTIASGEVPIGFGVADDRPFPAAVSNNDTVEVGDLRIALGEEETPILSGDPLAGRAGLVRVLARWLAPGFSLTQNKAVRAARLIAADGSLEAGYAIAEHVSFSR
jgi:hypothetical protein